MSHAKAYLVNGGSNAPDWLKRRGRRSKAGKAALISENSEEGVRLVQESDFPEASNCIKTSRDGNFIVATGTYKPRIKVFDTQELSLKFERITDNETVDFELLADDWTKSLHVQSDRTIELHDQRASYYRTRIPTPGRCVAYHFSSCDALFGAQGGYAYRLNLEQGRFLAPLALSGSPAIASDGSGPKMKGDSGSVGDAVTGINCIDVNPVHGLLAFGTETARGRGTVELWDHRVRSRVGILRLPYSRIATAAGSSAAIELPGLVSDVNDARPATHVAVTALASRLDGLNLAVGLSTGHTLLYDVRSPRCYAMKDQGYGLPIKRVQWPLLSRAGEGHLPLVASADEKVVKVWFSSEDTPNLVSINPPAPVNDMHILPGTGLMWLANEGKPLTAYYIPEMGPAPTWCRFLDNMTEEMEDDATPSIYEDYKFVDRQELRSLDLDHLIGTTALRPYMHGFFVDLRLYTKARAIANPFQYEEYRDRQIAAKLEAQRESRIRTSRAEENRRVKVNAALLERLKARDEAANEANSGKKRKREKERRLEGIGAADGLLGDDRFKRLFEDKDFEVDTTSREFALLNPSAAARQTKERQPDLSDEEEEDGFSDNSGADSSATKDSLDSSVDGDLTAGAARRASRGQRGIRDISRVDATVFESRDSSRPALQIERDTKVVKQTPDNVTLGQRRRALEASSVKSAVPEASVPTALAARPLVDGGREMTFVPDPAEATREAAEQRALRKAARVAKAAKAEIVGAGLHRTSGRKGSQRPLNEDEAGGRKRRRQVDRSASKKQMRTLGSY